MKDGRRGRDDVDVEAESRSHLSGDVDPPGPPPGDDAGGVEPPAGEDGGTSPDPARWARVKSALAGVGVVGLLATAILGSDVFGLRSRVFGSARPEPRPPAVSRLADGATPTGATVTSVAAQKTVLRSQPWWQGVTTLSGAGAMAPREFGISDGALQWRVKWSCQSGRLSVAAAGRARPVVDASCPGEGTGYATTTGSVTMQVQAEGPWQLQVDQQVDVPLNEPPLTAMTAPGSVRVSTGSFYRIDQTGTGTATLYRLADRSYALRFDDFFVTANSELDIRLSGLEEPKTSDQFLAAPSVIVAPLEVTTGSLNFSLPPDVDPSQYKSVVIWCRLIDSAYSAVTLGPPR